MWTTTYIRRHIAKLGNRELFVSRDFLAFGTRSAIDNALSMMVRSGEILRVARGVFMKMTIPLREPTALEVAKVKALAFGKKIFAHGADAAKELGFSVKGNEEPTFLTSGRTTSFQFGKIRIHLTGVTPRKIYMRKVISGKIVNALWYLNRRNDIADLRAVAVNLGRRERRNVFQSHPIMPGWLSDLCHTFRNGVVVL